MTSRERVLAALNHQPTDRIPIDFGGHRSSGILALAYARLKEYLGIRAGNIYVYDMPQQLAIIETALLDELGSDVVEMGRGFLLDDNDWQDWILPDGTPCKIPNYIRVEERSDGWYLLGQDDRQLAVRKHDSPYVEQIQFPLAERNFEKDAFENLEEQLNYSLWTAAPTPGENLPLDENGLRKLAEGAKKLRSSTDRAIIGIFNGSLFETPIQLFGMEKYLTYLTQYPEAVLRFTKKLCDIHLQKLEKWLTAVGSYIDIIQFSDDFGAQTGLLISREMYRKYFKPFQQLLFQRARELSDVKIMLHSCGAIEPLLDDLIDAGIDAINPVQISSAGMDPKTLKARYGTRLCFWGGGCDTRFLLSPPNPQTVARHVRQMVSIMQKGSGFIFQPPHNLLPDMPPENILAMFRAVNG